MDMIKIGILGITGILTALLVREMKPQFAALISMATCLIIFYYTLSRLRDMAGIFRDLTQYIVFKESYMEILLKIVGISYIADFTANLCKDAGFSAIAGQIEIFGKISILTVSLPVVLSLLNTIADFLQ